jgi:adenylate cyclase
MADGYSVRPDYRLDLVPTHKRIRAVFNGQTIADSTRVLELRETRHAPAYYFPKEDVRMDLMQANTHHTHCPFKGNASYWDLSVDGTTLTNVIWGYEQAFEEVTGLSGLVSFYWDKMDAWYEDEAEVLNQEDLIKSKPENPLVDWMLREAWDATTTRELVRRLVHQLDEMGAAVMRLNVVIRTLHPLLVANAYRWVRSSDEVERFDAEHDAITNENYMVSPLRPIFDGEGGVRRRVNSETAKEFPILEEFLEEGATDYAAMPMRFSDGQINALTITTDAADGFSTEILGQIHEVLPLMTRLFEIHAKERVAATLMRTFLGKSTGERVLNGLVKRGDSEDLHAVIWFCDLRNSTPLAESMTRPEFLDYLNRYFDCMAGAVVENGGEVLRFIGDAVLAIFPIESDCSIMLESCQESSLACERALEAAQTAQQLVAQANEELLTENRPQIEFGIGLHIGDVTYGNIGIPERLEFTVIGSAVNQAARIESMSKELGTSVIASQAFAKQSSKTLRSLGAFELRGIGGKQKLFAVSD